MSDLLGVSLHISYLIIALNEVRMLLCKTMVAYVRHDGACVDNIRNNDSRGSGVIECTVDPSGADVASIQ